jgi:hypothetical protein
VTPLAAPVPTAARVTNPPTATANPATGGITTADLQRAMASFQALAVDS